MVIVCLSLNEGSLLALHREVIDFKTHVAFSNCLWSVLICQEVNFVVCKVWIVMKFVERRLF